jgi:hypothetical protein
MAAVRWTLARIGNDLDGHHDSVPARALRLRVADLQAELGPGASRRPGSSESADASAWVADAMQAMGWIAEERGLGGSRSLDGLSWDLAVEQVWETWVDRFIATLAPRCGLTSIRRGQTIRSLHWQTQVASMRRLIPDSGLRAAGRVVWVDAKYKAHLQLLAHKGWDGLSEAVRESHRADLHQALAYTALDEATRVDSVLVYPELASTGAGQPAVATLPAGRRRLRLLLLGLPFGFRSEDHRQDTLARWCAVLAG